MNLQKRKISFGEKKEPFAEHFLSRMRCKKILKYLNRSNVNSVLDLGCGYDAKILSQLITELPMLEKAVGIDLSVNKNHPNKKISLIEADLNKKLPLADNEFNAIISTAVLEHLVNPLTALEEMRRVLKYDGILFLTTPTPSAKPILEFLTFKLKFLDLREINDHKNYFSKSELNELLKKAGFAHIEIKTFQFGFNNLVICRK